MLKDLKIGENIIDLGETRKIALVIAKLPTHTVIEIPIFIFRGKKEGPGLLLTAGLHGDEINGIEIIREMIVKKYLKVKAGFVVAIPLVNIYGFLIHSREVPDGKDINRSFPGSKDGSLAKRVAYEISSKILPIIDVGIDFHTGGDGRSNYPQVRCEFENLNNLELAKAFSPPFIVNSKFRINSLRHEAEIRNKNIIVYEGGENLRFNTLAINEGIKGTLRLMNYLGMTSKNRPPNKIVKINKNHWIRAKISGLFKTFVKLGTYIEKKELLGVITDPFGETEYKIIAKNSGYIIGLNQRPIVSAGDAIIHVGL